VCGITDGGQSDRRGGDAPEMAECASLLRSTAVAEEHPNRRLADWRKRKRWGAKEHPTLKPASAMAITL